ncbi:hypothetical protein [Roseomonas sp. WA12]
MTIRTTPTGVPLAAALMSDMARYGVVFAPADEGQGGGSDDGYDDDAGSDVELDEAGGDDAFLKNLIGEEAAGDDEDSDDAEDDAEVEDEPSEDEPKEPARKPAQAKTAEDDAEVEVKVGETAHKVKVSDLKRLFGQEAALTQKSQEVSEARTQALARAEAAQTVLTKALEKAEERFAPYKDMNFLVMSKRVDDATLEQLMQDAQAARADVEFYRTEIEKVGQAAHQTRVELDTATVAQAKATLTADFPKEFGVAWDDTVYGEIVTFAEAQGLQSARQIVDPAVMKLLRMAQLYQKGKEVAKTQVKKVAEQPRRPMRSGSGSKSADRGSDGRFDGAMSRLRRTGSAADAEAAFLSRMRPRD